MRILIVKTSSMSGVFQTLPAVTDAQEKVPGIVFDWVVEDVFTEIPSWHAAVDKVIPVSFRRWHKHPLATLRSPEWKQFKNQLRRQHYDLVIDCQGMLKSALVGRMAKAPIAGGDRKSVREPAAAWFYHHRFPLDLRQHKVERTRSLFAQALNYQKPDTLGDYGIDTHRFRSPVVGDRNIVLLHSSYHAKKLYPEDYWRSLAEKLVLQGYRVRLPWGTEVEHERARRIAKNLNGVEVMPRLNLHGLACLLVQANAVVSLESGLCQLSAALGVPTLSLYGDSRPEIDGAYGANQYHLSTKKTESQVNNANVELFQSLPPDIVMEQLQQLILDNVISDNNGLSLSNAVY